MPNYKNMEYHVNLLGGVSGFSNPGGRTFYVGATGWAAVPDGQAPAAASTNDGLTPQSPLNTIQAGLDKCVTGRGDVVAVLPGSYTITEALSMGKDDVTLCSAYPVGRRQRGPVTIVSAADDDMLAVNANNCKVVGLTFDDNVASNTAGYATINVNTSSTGVDYTGTIIKNCYIDQQGADATDRDGICLGTDADDGALASLVQGCVIVDAGNNGIIINVGSELSVIRDCHIFDISDTTQYGVEVLATSIHIEDCDIYITYNTTGAGIHNGVAAARLVANHNKIHAIGADTTCILAIDTATQRTARNWLTALAAQNLVDYLTASTSPSADCNIKNIYAANAGDTAFDTPGVAGA